MKYWERLPPQEFAARRNMVASHGYASHRSVTPWIRDCQRREKEARVTRTPYKPSYRLMDQIEVEICAARCLHLMDVYTPGTLWAQAYPEEARQGYLTAWAAAISWLSR